MTDAVVELWQGTLDQPDDVRARLELLLSHDERERASAFRFARDRNRYVVGRGVLRGLLGRYTGADPASLEFRYGRDRKPALAGDGPFFNLAHSEDAVAYAFSPSFEVGIDVEVLRDDASLLDLADRFFSPREAAELRALPERDRSRAFLACWTRKEAFLKARGDGLTLALDSFDVTLAPGEPARLVRTAWSRRESDRWQLADISTPAGPVAAVAARARGWTVARHDLDPTTVVTN